MKRYLMVISDGPFSGTGFSEQMRHILFGLAQTGQFDISWQCLQHMGYPYELYDYVFPDVPHKGTKIKVYGTYGDPFHFGADAFLKNYREINPEMVLFMGDPRNIIPFLDYKIRLGFPLIMYCTLDGVPIHPQWIEPLKHVNLLVAMTEWAAEEYYKVGFHPAWIHHGINSKWWKVDPEEKYTIRRKYGIPDDAVVFINWDIPQHRKRPDALLRCWKEFHPKNKNAVLILYTDWNLSGSLGWNLEDLIKQYEVPRQTIFSPTELQGTPKFYDHAERPELLKEIACMGDVYPSTTSGEGFGMCLHPDSPIITSDGVKKISEIIIGDQVLDENGKWVEVLATKSKEYNGQLIKIDSYGNIPIFVTPDHLIKAFKRPNKKWKIGREWNKQKPIWIKAEDLKKGDVVLFPIFSDINVLDELQTDVFDLLSLDSTLKTDGDKVWYHMGYSKNGKKIKVNRFIKLDRDLAKLLGIYTAEGSENEISVGKDLRIIDELKRIYIDKFGTIPKIYDGGTVFRFTITEKIVSLFLMRLCGKGAKNKTIPISVLEHRNRFVLKDFLRYYWLGDGEKKTFLSGFTTISEKLTTALKLALSSLQEIPMIEKDNGNDCYRIYSRSSKRTHSNKAWFNEHGFVGYLINKIEREDYVGMVVDIQTNGSFSTLSFTVHNCGLEAMGMGIPVVITDYAASSEVHRKGSILVPCYEGRAGRFRLDDRRRSVEAGIVNEELFTQALDKLYKDRQFRQKLGLEALRWSRKFDFQKQIIPKWQQLLGGLNTDLIAAKELLNI